MDIISILFVAVGLAMDAFAVSIATGITTSIKRRKKNALIMASSFGAFQFFMPLVGWAAGLTLESVISSVDHWVAFGLLVFVGAKMIHDSTKKADENKIDNLRFSRLLMLSIATSIDALMVGLSFAFLQTGILEPVVVIGVVTFCLSFAGFIFGCKIGEVFEHRIKILGGLIIIGMGIKILLDALL